MPFAIQVLRPKRDGHGQPMKTTDGEPCGEIVQYRICPALSDALIACDAIGIGGELRGLMAEDDIAEQRSVEIPRRAITALKLNVPQNRLNDRLMPDWVELEALRDARLAATEPTARCFLLAHA